MKKIAYAIGAALTAASPAFAGADGGGFQDYARVREVDPQYERINVPRKECYSEYVPESRYERGNGRSLVGPLIGGVAGGLLGAQVGKGNGRVAAAATGAAVGAIVGDRLQDRGSGRYEYAEREVRRCRMVDDWQSRPAGYRVVYEYAGHVYTTVLPYDPGNRLAVNVSIAPAEGRHGRHGDDDWDD
jgi:uncharacterized protein YcfJ